jgi:hypothetical protein
MRVGSRIVVRSIRIKMLTRRVVEIRGSIVVITSESEWQAAKENHREPLCVGFPLGDVVEVLRDSN